MPVLTWSQSVAAGATYQPLNGWQYEYVPSSGSIRILHNATGAGVVATVTSGSDTLQERSPVGAGGTAGVLPSPLNNPELVDAVDAGDRIKVLYENTSGGALTVNGFVDYTPLG